MLHGHREDIAAIPGFGMHLRMARVMRRGIDVRPGSVRDDRHPLSLPRRRFRRRTKDDESGRRCGAGGTNNAVWGVQFIWPIKAEYVIVDVDSGHAFICDWLNTPPEAALANRPLCRRRQQY